jgi:hypothetical protein
VTMCQYVRITVCDDVSVCSKYSMFRLQYVAMCQYVQITVCGDVSVCSDYSMWRCVSMFGLQYVAKYQYARLVGCGARSVYPVILFSNVSMLGIYVSGKVSVPPVTTSSAMLRYTKQNTKFTEFAVAVPIAQ